MTRRRADLDRDLRGEEPGPRRPRRRARSRAGRSPCAPSSPRSTATIEWLSDLDRRPSTPPRRSCRARSATGCERRRARARARSAIAPPRKSSGSSQPRLTIASVDGRLGAAAVVGRRARVRRRPSAARRGRCRRRRRRRSSRRRRRSCRRRPSGSSPGTGPTCVSSRCFIRSCAALREPDVGRGAADVERDDAVEARLPPDPDAADDAGDRARHEQVDRAARWRPARVDDAGAPTSSGAARCARSAPRSSSSSRRDVAWRPSGRRRR